MIRDYSTGKTKFVQIKVSSPDGRFGQEPERGGITKKTAIFIARQYPKAMIIDIFDSRE